MVVIMVHFYYTCPAAVKTVIYNSTVLHNLCQQIEWLLLALNARLWLSVFHWTYKEENIPNKSSVHPNFCCCTLLKSMFNCITNNIYNL